MIYYTFVYRDTKEQVLKKKWKRRSSALRLMDTLERRFNKHMEIVEIEIETKEERLIKEIRDLRESISYLIAVTEHENDYRKRKAIARAIKKEWSLISEVSKLMHERCE